MTTHYLQASSSESVDIFDADTEIASFTLHGNIDYGGIHYVAFSEGTVIEMEAIGELNGKPVEAKKAFDVIDEDPMADINIYFRLKVVHKGTLDVTIDTAYGVLDEYGDIATIKGSYAWCTVGVDCLFMD